MGNLQECGVVRGGLAAPLPGSDKERGQGLYGSEYEPKPRALARNCGFYAEKKRAMAEKGIGFRAGGSGFKPGPGLGASGRGCEALGCPCSSGMRRNRGVRGAFGSGSSPGRLCRRGRPNSWWRRRSQQKWDLQELSSLGRLKCFLSSLTSRPPSRLGSLAPGPCCCSAWDFLLLRPCQSRNSPRPCSTSLCSSQGGISKASAAPPVPPSHLGAC